MKYKNISGTNKWIVCQSVKQLIPPDGIVNLSHTDIRHAGSAMRFFESVHKAQEIADDLFRRQSEKFNRQIPEKVNGTKSEVKPEVKPEESAEQHVISEVAEDVVSHIIEDD